MAARPREVPARHRDGALAGNAGTAQHLEVKLSPLKEFPGQVQWESGLQQPLLSKHLKLSEVLAPIPNLSQHLVITRVTTLGPRTSGSILPINDQARSQQAPRTVVWGTVNLVTAGEEQGFWMA